MTWIACMSHLLREALILCQDRVFASFWRVLSLSSVLGSYDLTSQTSNIMQHPVPLVSYLFPFESCQAMFDLTLLLWLFLFGTGTWAERSYERGSVLASFRPPNGLSISLLRIGSFVFFWNSLWCYGSILNYMWQSSIFLEKIMSKMVKNGYFGLSKKIKSLVLSGIDVKWKLLWSFNILQKLHVWKKSGCQVMDKNSSWPMRF